MARQQGKQTRKKTLAKTIYAHLSPASGFRAVSVGRCENLFLYAHLLASDHYALKRKLAK